MHTGNSYNIRCDILILGYTSLPSAPLRSRIAHAAVTRAISASHRPSSPVCPVQPDRPYPSTHRSTRRRGREEAHTLAVRDGDRLRAARLGEHSDCPAEEREREALARGGHGRLDDLEKRQDRV